MLLVKTVLKYSAIHGVGCFAVEDIPKDTIVWRLDPGIDLILNEEQLKTFPASFRTFLEMYAYSPLDAKEKLHILCIDHARHMNHSETPNLAETLDGKNVAMRDIKAGEELTCDYRDFDQEFNQKLKAT